MPVDFEHLLDYFRSLVRFDIISLFQLGCISDGGYIASLLSNILMILMVVLAVLLLYLYQKSECEHEDYGKDDKEHKKHLEEIFKQIDEDGEGITAKEVAHILKKCDTATDATKKLLKKFKHTEARKSNSISSEELRKIMKEYNMDPDENSAAQEVFEAAGGDVSDPTNDHQVDFDKFHSVLDKFHSELTEAREAKLAEDAAKLVANADKSNTGRLNFEEFHDAVVAHASGSEADGTVDFQVLVKKKALADVRDVASGRLFLLVFLLYPSLTNKIFEGLSCRSIGKDYSVLYVDYSIDCGSLEYAALATVCLALVLIWPIGLPSGLLYYMWQEKDAIVKEDVDTLQKFSFVLGDYNTKYWYWEVIELSRKLILTGLISLFQRGSIAQTVVATMLSFFFFALTIRAQPFQTKHLNIIKVVSEIQLFVILLVCCVLQTHSQGFATETVTPEDYGQLQVFATVAVMPITAYLLIVGLRDVESEFVGTVGHQEDSGSVTEAQTGEMDTDNKGTKDKKDKKSKKDKKDKKDKKGKKSKEDKKIKKDKKGKRQKNNTMEDMEMYANPIDAGNGEYSPTFDVEEDRATEGGGKSEKFDNPLDE
jgi:Ca2+/Na+ antiporter